MSRSGGYLAAGLGLIILGLLLAHLTQTAGGIEISAVRFPGADDRTLSAHLYVPPNASAAEPAPGILAVHGYINSREAQSGFAIEFARRGYVVLALDQPGHGYSDPPAFAGGFGGPAALQYLRALPLVDTDNIGLEGHSMGGWSVLAAAVAFPDQYRAVVLQGSSTGPPFAQPGTPTWPRNLCLVFSAYDEFSQLMWESDRALDVASGAKLKTLFGTAESVVPGRLYGDVSLGTARKLTQPPVTHPGDHLSRAAIGDAIDWFALTLDGGQPLPTSDQRWPWKELGTLLALLGSVVLMLGLMRLLLFLPPFRPLQREQVAEPVERTRSWWLLATLSALLPALTFYFFFGLGERWLPASTWLPQGITNQVLIWALGNAALGWLLTRLLGEPVPSVSPQWLRAGGFALAVILPIYGLVAAANGWLNLDFRFWFVGLKTPSVHQFELALRYLIPFSIYFVIVLRGLHGPLASARGVVGAYLINAALLAGGVAALLLLQYGTLFTTGRLFTPSEPLNTIIMIQFVPLLAIVAVLSTCAFRLTNDHRPGALLCALFVTWYVVAGQATQVV